MAEVIVIWQRTEAVNPKADPFHLSAVEPVVKTKTYTVLL